MSVFSDERYLPGVSTEIISNYQQTYDTTLWGTTDSLVVIGTAFNGPTNILTPVWNPTHAQYVFGGAYDSKTKTEVDLLAGVQEAWNKGCRTIYCLRLGGIPLYKDFEMRLGSSYKLRVSSLYPTNTGKQAYFTYDDSLEGETLTFYKVPDRATMSERNQGLVESTNQMLKTTLRINQDYGFTKDSRLVDVITLFNEHTFNNVLRLAIIDRDGNDVTASSEVFDIPFGAMFPGTYFIGRKGNTADMPAKTRTSVTPVFKDTPADKLPYASFAGNFFVTLNYNSDVSSAYPIYGSGDKELEADLLKAGISVAQKNDYLDVLESSNKAFAEDDVDYEETHLSDFEKYTKLGDGFGITASLQKRTDAAGNELLPKVIETKSNNANRVIGVGVGTGIYSTLQDAPVDFRALGSLIPADKVISGKLPKASDFLTALPQGSTIIPSGDDTDTKVPYLVSIDANIDTSDVTTKPRRYTFELQVFDKAATPELSRDNMYTDQIFDLIATVDTEDDIDLSVPNHTRFLVPVNTAGASTYDIIGPTKPTQAVYHLKAVVDGALVDVTPEQYVDSQGRKTYVASGEYLFEPSYDETKKELTFTQGEPAALADKTYALINIKNVIYVWKRAAAVTKAASVGAFEPVADLDSLSDDYGVEDKVFVYVESLANNVNRIMVSSADLETMSVQDFVNALNENKAFSALFTASLTAQGIQNKDEYMKTMYDPQDPNKVLSQGVADSILGKVLDFGVDRKISYDYDKYIPYRTTDNFARQLAQHCTYTELKTARTHGVIGCARIMDTSINSVARKAASLAAFNFDMYAKKPNGRNMLDNKNTPYNIGRNVSITCFQENVSIDNGAYTFLANGAPGYAGFVSQLDLAQSSTAQTIDVVPGFEFTHSQLMSLTSKGIVTVRNSYTRGYVVTDGTTMADSSDGLKRLSSTRIVGAVEAAIRAASEPFIGKPNSTTNRNSLKTAIDAGLKQLKDNGLLRSYEFKLVDDATALMYTYVTINYTIVPVNEIREVRNIITVTNSALE